MSKAKDKIVLNIANVFLDRDGTVIEDRSYLGDPTGVRLLPGAVEGLARFTDQGLKLFVVTNQSGIGRGYFSQEDYLACRAQLHTMLLTHDIHISGEAFCPHEPDSGCDCRKPNPGMWRQLAKAHALKAESSMIIGDKASDLEFGYGAGFALSALVLTGEGSKTAVKLEIPDSTLKQCQKNGTALVVDGKGRQLLLANDLNSVADWVLPRLA